MQRSDNRYNPTARTLPEPANAFYAMGNHAFTRTPSGTWYSTLKSGSIIKVGQADSKRLEELLPVKEAAIATP